MTFSSATVLLPGRGQRAGTTTPTLFTPLHAIYTRPSTVAAILRTVPPPDGIFVREVKDERAALGSGRFGKHIVGIGGLRSRFRCSHGLCIVHGGPQGRGGTGGSTVCCGRIT